MKHIFTSLFFLTFCCCTLYSQQVEQVGAPGVKVNNFTTFDQPATRFISQELFDQTAPEFQNHPEFGILPYNAPCTDCFEIIEKRTANTKYYVKKGTNGQTFYSSASGTDLHYKDENGRIITIDPRLFPDKYNSGIYKSTQQADPTELNMVDGYTSMQLMEKSIFKFNKDLKIYSTNDFIQLDNVAFINRSNYTAGRDGALVTNAFNQIDQELIFGEAMIKSNYLIKDLSAINTSDKFFVIEDEFLLPDGFILKKDIYEGTKNDYDFWNGELILENANGIELARFMTPIMYDSTPLDTLIEKYNHANAISYVIEQNGNLCKLKLVIETSWLNSAVRVFPLIIDPTVFGTTTTWIGTSGTDDSPNFCTLTVAVPTPAMATLTGSSVYWDFYASGVACSPFCKMKFLQVYVTTNCSAGASGFSPGPGDPLLGLGGVWICPGCNAAGPWTPTIDDASSASLVSCYTPTCAASSINFTLHHNQFQCVTPGACVNTCAYVRKFIITIQGETVDATALAEGAATYTVLDCAHQNGYLSALTPIYGVPGYTYSWSPGGLTGSPVFVTFPMGVTVYTLTITDACGNTSTDNITVTNNCLLLPINLLSFSGYHAGEANYLNWVTASEKNNDAFIIERSATGLDFQSIGTVEGNGTTNEDKNYTFTDLNPFEGINYYRLKQVDENEEFSYSDVIAIQSADVHTTSIVINNETISSNTLSLTIFSKNSGQSDLNIFDITGKKVMSNKVYVGSGANTVTLQMPDIAKGAYVISFVKENENAEAKFVK